MEVSIFNTFCFEGLKKLIFIWVLPFYLWSDLGRKLYPPSLRQSGVRNFHRAEKQKQEQLVGDSRMCGKNFWEVFPNFFFQKLVPDARGGSLAKQAVVAENKENKRIICDLTSTFWKKTWEKQRTRTGKSTRTGGEVVRFVFLARIFK